MTTQDLKTLLESVAMSDFEEDKTRNALFHDNARDQRVTMGVKRVTMGVNLGASQLAKALLKVLSRSNDDKIEGRNRIKAIAGTKAKL